MLDGCPAFETYEEEVPIWFVRRKSWADAFDSNCSCFDTANGLLSWPNLDGSNEPQTTSSDLRRSSAGAADLPTPTDRALAAPAVPSRPRGNTVADRIKALNHPAKGQDAPTVNRDIITSPDGRPHRTSTNLSKRMSPFVRRNAESSPMTEQQLAVQSKEPLKPAVIHGPIPQRHPSILLHSRDLPSPSEVSRSEREPSGSTRPDFIRRQAHTSTASNPIVPTGVLSTPTRLTCTRHGRSLPVKRRGPTLEGLERSRSGAYIPSGHKIRHQIPTTSPYYYQDKILTKTEGTSLSPEPCPDCLAEESIRRREAAEEKSLPLVPTLRHGDSQRSVDASSTITEPGTPVEDALTGPTLIGSSVDHQAVLLPGSSVPGIIEADMSSVVAADLGDMIDAIIIEHRGTLNRVITNLRNGAPTMDSFQQISKDLAKVSSSMSTMRPERADIFDRDRGRYSVILDTPPEFLKSRTKSIPDLVDYIDSAAKDLGVELPPQTGSAMPTPRAESRAVPTSASPLEEPAVNSRERAAIRKSLVPPSAAVVAQAPSTYATANPTPSSSPVMRSGSRLIIAVDVAPALLESNAVPQTELVSSARETSRVVNLSGDLTPRSGSGENPSTTVPAVRTMPSEVSGSASTAVRPGGTDTAAPSYQADGSNIVTKLRPEVTNPVENVRTDGA